MPLETIPRARRHVFFCSALFLLAAASPRSFPDYPGGTSLQRWHRNLHRCAMESEGFAVHEAEWWYFDYKDWKEYPILNVPFEKLDSGHAPASFP